MTLYSDFVEVTVEAADVSDYVITYQRSESLCEPGQMFTLTMTRKKPDDSFLDIEVGDAITIKEKYGGSPDTVLKGFVTKVDISADKALMTVNGADKYIMLADYFIPERLETSGETVAYWIEYICNEAGLNVQFDASPYNLTEGVGDAEGTPLGMQSALEAIKLLERKGTCYTRYDSDVNKIVVYRLQDSQPKVNVNSDNLISIDRSEATKTTRNVVKVWGGYRYDWLTGEEVEYNAQARAEIPEMVVDQTTVVASPEIRSVTFANIVAQRILASTADLDDIAICECAGLYPSVKIGEWIFINISQGEFSYTRERQITSINISVDTNGATTSFTVGEKCPRVSVSPPVVPIYVTDTKNGVGVSWDAGDTFSPSNWGLTSSGQLDGKSIAVNNYGRQMVVTAAGLHKRWTGLSTWQQVTNLPDPTNESNDPSPLGITNLEMLKVVDEPLKPYTFHMIVSGGHPSGWYRSYVYTTEDYGYNWNTTQMWVPALSGGLADPYYQEHPLAPSGRVYDVWTHDMTASLGNNVTVLVSSPYLPLEEQSPQKIYFLATFGAGTQYRYWEYDGQSHPTALAVCAPAPSGFKIMSDFMSAQEDRSISYVAIDSTDGPLSTYEGSIAYLWRSTDYGQTASLVAELPNLYDGGDEIYKTRGCAFDQSSDSDEFRAVFWQCEFDWTNGDDFTVKAIFIKDDPSATAGMGSSSSWTYKSLNISLENPSIGGGETWNNYTTNPNAANYPTKFSRGTGFAFGLAGFYGSILNQDDPPDIIGRGLNLTVFKFDFDTESIIEWEQYVTRTTLTTAQINGRTGPSTEDGDGLYVFIYGNRLWYWTATTSTEIDPSIKTVQTSLDIDATHTTLAGWTMEGFPNYYRYLLYTDGTETQWTNFYPAFNAGKQFENADTLWWWGNTSLGSTPGGFVYGTDGYNWTQYWDDTFHSPRPSTVAQHFDFMILSGSW